MFKSRPTEPNVPTDAPRANVGVITLPRSRRSASTDLAAARRQRKRNAAQAEVGRTHGWARSDDPIEGPRAIASFLDRRRRDGTPLLLFTVLAVLTGVGLARVNSRIEILQIANEITDLSEDQRKLLDRKRRLETERAYLRRPARVAEQATERLGMEPAPPERIQKIELEPAPEPEPEPEPDPDPDPGAGEQP